MPISITVPWEIWIDGENRFQAYVKNNKKEPNYVTIPEKQVKIIDWKDSQNRVNKFIKDNNNKNPLTVRLTIATSTTVKDNVNTSTNSITVPWEVWKEGEKRFQESLKKQKKDPNYMIIKESQVQLKDWKDSQNRVNKFIKDNNNKNPLTVGLTIPSTTIVAIEIPDPGIVSPPDYNTDPKTGKIVKTDGYYKCTCGERPYNERWKVTFKNRCAHADDPSHKIKSSQLVWSTKKDVAVLEGQWTCEGCDADYCAVTGKEKDETRPNRLTMVSEVKMPG